MNDRKGQDHGGKWLKVQVERQTHNPGNSNHERNHKDGNLDGGPQSNPNCQIHLVLHSYKDGSDMLTGISSNRQNDQP